jgi:hypothetical protein
MAVNYPWFVTVGPLEGECSMTDFAMREAFAQLRAGLAAGGHHLQLSDRPSHGDGDSLIHGEHWPVAPAWGQKLPSQKARFASRVMRASDAGSGRRTNFSSSGRFVATGLGKFVSAG